MIFSTLGGTNFVTPSSNCFCKFTKLFFISILILCIISNKSTAQFNYFNTVTPLIRTIKAYNSTIQGENQYLNLMSGGNYIPLLEMEEFIYKYNSLGNNIQIENYSDLFFGRRLGFIHGTYQDGYYYLATFSDTVFTDPSLDTSASWSFPWRRYEFIKLDTQLNVIWYKHYDRPGMKDEFCGNVFPVQGGFILCGGVDTLALSVWNNAHIMKVDTAGNELWHRTIADIYNGHMQYWDGVELPDHSFVCLGFRFNWLDIVLTKYDSLGNVIWHKYYNSGYNDQPWSLLHNADGSFMITGWRDNADGDSTFACLVKVNSEGVFQWRKIFPRGEHSSITDIVQNEDGTYNMVIVYEYIGTEDTVYSNFIRLDAIGMEIQYERHIKSASIDSVGRLKKIFHAEGGGYVLGGSTYTKDPWLVKVDNCGYIIGPTASVASYTVSQNTLSISTSCTEYEDITYHWGDGSSSYLSTEQDTSHIYGDTGSYTVLVIAHRCGSSDTAAFTIHIDSLALGIVESSPQYDAEIYPNPSHTAITIQIDKDIDTNTTISIYAMDGSHIFTEPVSSCIHHLDISHLSNAMYILHLRSGTHTNITRFVKE